ncbi:MAG: tyrosine-type recombinase/integrase [Acidobacteriales bacterium]|nr:tyrosine-type recombinase/integrase [Terriglobales bacterium]
MTTAERVENIGAAGRSLALNGNCISYELPERAAREMKVVLKRAGLFWHGWHGFRGGLASNLNRLGVDDSVIQRMLRHSTVATTQNHYIKTASPDAIAAMRQFSEALMCSTCAPDGGLNPRGSVAVGVDKCPSLSEWRRGRDSNPRYRC